MNKKLPLFLSLVGVGFFWSALIAEVNIRFFPGDFIVLASLVFVSCLSTGVLVYAFVIRQEPASKSVQTAEERTTGPTRQGRSQSNQKRRGPRDGDQARTRSGAQSSDRAGRSRPSQQAARSAPRPDRRTKNPAKSERNQGTSNTRNRGQIKSYSQRQSYGFIRGDDGKQAFFHKTNLDPGLEDKSVEKDLVVTYELQEGDRGPVATKIQLAK